MILRKAAPFSWCGFRASGGGNKGLSQNRKGYSEAVQKSAQPIVARIFAIVGGENRGGLLQ
jgi:hypothetical protein